jgi:DNA polymerase-3 subunit alpha
MVAYVMRITDLDPLKYNLHLRALPQRRARVDAGYRHRLLRQTGASEVIQYVRDKYGMRLRQPDHHVRHDGQPRRASATSAACSRCRCRSHRPHREEGPAGPRRLAEGKSLDADPDLQAIREESGTNGRLFEICGLQARGPRRHNVDRTPPAWSSPTDRWPTTCRSAKNGDEIITQWQMTELEEVGLLKVDFLGLKTLTILDRRRCG